MEKFEIDATIKRELDNNREHDISKQELLAMRRRFNFYA